MVKPVFQRLSEDSLLEKCLHGKTQNQNESLNGMIWEHVTKDTFTGFEALQLRVHAAVAHIFFVQSAREKDRRSYLCRKHVETQIVFEDCMKFRKAVCLIRECSDCGVNKLELLPEEPQGYQQKK